MPDLSTLALPVALSLLLSALIFKRWAITRVFTFISAWHLLVHIRPHWLDGMLLGLSIVALEVAYARLKMRPTGNTS